MTDLNDDFEQPEFNHEEPPPPRRGIGSNLASAWRSQPLFKLFVLMVVVAAVVAVGVSFFSGSNSHSVASFVKPPELNEAPGGKASPYMKQQTELANSQRSQDALRSGGSALPTPIGQTGDAGDLNATARKDEQLTELKAEVDNMNKQVQQMKQAPPPQAQQQQQQQQQFDDSLAMAMQKQLNTLAESWTPKGVVRVPVTKVEDEKTKEAKAEAAAAAAGSASSSRPKAVVPGGTVSYAQLLTEANSDVPGPILAQIVSGPLAGARAVGSFQVANGTADYLVLQFSTANLKGKDYALNAVALDPDTTLGGLATEVDQRYFTRLVLPAAAGFLQGFGSALYEGGSNFVENANTTIVTQGRQGVRQGAFYGLGQASQTASQFFQNQANLTKPLVRVAAGTPIGMFFVTTVVEPQNQNDVSGIAGAQPTYPVGYNGLPAGYAPANGYAQAGGYGAGGANPQIGGGYPGSTVSGYGGNNPGNVPYPNYATPGSLGAPGQVTSYGGNGGYGGGGNVIYPNRYP